jgi:hypothetical protein
MDCRRRNIIAFSLPDRFHALASPMPAPLSITFSPGSKSIMPARSGMVATRYTSSSSNRAHWICRSSPNVCGTSNAYDGRTDEHTSTETANERTERFIIAHPLRSLRPRLPAVHDVAASTATSAGARVQPRVTV